MNNKQLAEMVRKLRKEKLEEIIGKPPPFDPVHPEGKQDASSPNQYAHRKQSVAEGARIARGNRLGKGTLGNLRKRADVHIENGSQSSRHRYLNKNNPLEENDKIKLGKTDTGQNGTEAEEVTVNPEDTTFSAIDPTNKNTTTKETKEK